MCGHAWYDRRGNHHVCYLPAGHPTRHWCSCGDRPTMTAPENLEDR